MLAQFFFMKTNNQIKIVIAEDHHLIHEGFANMLNEIDNFKVIELADNEQKLID